LGKSAKEEPGAFLPDDLHIVRPTPKDDAGPELMLAARERGENPACVIDVRGLADHLPIEPANRVGGEDQSVLDLRRDGGGLQPGDRLHVMTWIAEPLPSRLVDVRR